MINSKGDFIMMVLLFVSGGNILAGIGSLFAILYYVSILKVNVVDRKYKGNWGIYIKSIFKSK